MTEEDMQQDDSQDELLEELESSDSGVDTKAGGKNAAPERVDFFDTKAALELRKKFRMVQEFTDSVCALIAQHGKDNEPLRYWEIEAMIAALPHVEPDFAFMVAEFVSDNGGDYTSYHEIQARAQQQIEAYFRLTYLAYLRSTGQISAMDLDEDENGEEHAPRDE